MLLSFLLAGSCLALKAQTFKESNWATNGFAYQSSESNGGTADRAIDGNTDGNWASNSTTHSGGTAMDNGDPFWELDLQAAKPIGRIQVWFRTDCCQNRNDDFTLIVMSADRQELWKRTYAGRPPATVAFNLAPSVTGQIIRFVPQNPPTTSDGFFSLAEVQVIAPYTGASISVTQNPTNVTILEGRFATLGPVAATVTGPPQDRLTIQWQKNGVDIPGATSATYTTPVVQALADNNTEYSVRFLLSGQAVASEKAKLIVDKDTVPPVVEAVTLGSGATLEATVKFNEVMEAASAQNTANYSFGAGVTVTKAVLSGVLLATGDNHPYQQVVLSVSGLAQNVPYSLAVSGVKDLAGNLLATATFTGLTPFFEVNWAQSGTATQSSTAAGGDAWHAIDGKTDGFWDNGSVTLNAAPEDPGWWEVDLGALKPIGRLAVWFRTLNAAECQALFNSCAVRNDDFTLSILDANRKAVWTRTYPGRPPLKVAYNLPAGLSGRYVRFESQTPLSTSDGYFSLAEVQAIAPYTNVAVTVTKDLSPTNSVAENRRLLLGPVTATLAGATNAPADALVYQWQRNGVDIAGANAASYQTPPLAMADTGARYRVNLLISGAAVASTETVVTVEKDTVPPTIKSVTGGLNYTVEQNK